MFKSKFLKVCPVTGVTEIEIQFIYWNNPQRTIKEAFKTQLDAKRRIKFLKIEYLLFHLEEYVQHCKTLMETGESYSTEGKNFAYDTCIRGIHHFQDKPLHTIAGYVVKLQPMLLKLLPGENSTYYANLYQIYIRLITFCQSEQNPLKEETLCLEQ